MATSGLLPLPSTAKAPAGGKPTVGTHRPMRQPVVGGIYPAPVWSTGLMWVVRLFNGQPTDSRIYLPISPERLSRSVRSVRVGYSGEMDALIAVVLVLHGVAHLVPVLASKREEAVAENLILGQIATLKSDISNRYLVPLAFGICAALFLVGGLAESNRTPVPTPWWKPATDIGAVLSMLSMVAFPRAFPPRFRYATAAIVVNVLIIGNWLQLWDWPQ